MRDKKNYVLGFAFSEDKESVLLIEKLKPEWQAGLLNGIGGKVEGSEHPLAAMIREFKEECGISTDVHHWKQFLEMNGRFGTVYCYFAFMDISGANTMEDEEVVEAQVERISYLETISNLPWLIGMALDPDNFTAKVKYDQ